VTRDRHEAEELTQDAFVPVLAAWDRHGDTSDRSGHRGIGLTPEELAASSPPIGGRWSVEATLVVPPDGEAQLCASYVEEVCEAGAPVTGPVAEGQDELVIEATWFVIVREGSLEDPIRAS
jgi:hypothetical protein